MTQGRARGGKPSSAKRVAAWRERANRAYAQWRVAEIEMGALAKSSRMTAAIQLYHDRLPQLCERLKSSTERWLQALWRRLMMQHVSRVLSVIVKQWQLLIRTKHSVIYQLVSTRTATGYCGMDEYRVCTERYKEHLSSIRDSDYNDDKKYAFMSRNGGPGAWIFIQYIFSHIPVPKQILLTPESREIQLYPKLLNKEQRYCCQYLTM